MPIYEYECKHCNKIWTRLAKFDDDFIACPKCLNICWKIISKSNFHLKGDGWAKDSYSTPKKK